MVFDWTCAGRWGLPGLTTSWRLGGSLYGALGRLDAWFPAATWEEALGWFGSHLAPRPIAEIQFWGHGRWGSAQMGGASLDVSALEPAHPYQPFLGAIRTRMVPQRGLWWFRTCETFGRAEGHAFARAWTRFFGCRAAGHTYVIGPYQSGLHSLGPDDEPGWPLDEGLPRSTSQKPARVALWSTPWAPNTITCFHGSIPEGM